MIIPQFVQKEKPAGKRSSAGFLYTMPSLGVHQYGLAYIVYHTSSILSIIFSLLPIDVRQYGTRAAISTWHSWSTYRNRAIFRSYLPSGARFITAFICSALSPCNAGGKTMRAADTGSTEPERLRQLSRVAHHYGDVTEAGCFREVKKTFVYGVHFVDVNKMLVCSACHNKLLSARNKRDSPDWEENAPVYKPGLEGDSEVFFANRFAVASPDKEERRKKQKLCKNSNNFCNKKCF